MFEDKVASKVVALPDCEEFIECFMRFREDGAAGRLDGHRVARFEERIDSLWSKLSQIKQDVVIETLISKGAIPEALRMVFRVFPGSRVKKLR
jgi:hypothetical protein